jgi:hypothetical protein
MALAAKEYTISGLAAELKMDKRRVGSLLEDLEPHRKSGRIGYYWMRDVFDHLLKNEQERLDPQQEQARLNESRRRKVDLETEVMRGELCRTSDVEMFWSNHITNCKTRLLAIPHKTAHRVMAAKEISEGMKILEDEVREALEELAGNVELGGAPDTDGKEGVESTA